jgi:hypothetical protein
MGVIAGYYWEDCRAAGLNADLVWAQLIHETGGLSSWWSQRPQRNGAGLGVTGVTTHSAPLTRSRIADGVAIGTWSYNSHKAWAEGLSFPSWEVSARAHVGRLLLYASGLGATADQRALTRWARLCRPLNAALYGSAPTLRELGRVHNQSGQGWADPGTEYGQNIADGANFLLSTRAA